jgi:hypothetical protein
MRRRPDSRHGWIVVLDGIPVGDPDGWPCRGEALWHDETTARHEADKLATWGAVTVKHI